MTFQSSGIYSAPTNTHKNVERKIQGKKAESKFYLKNTSYKLLLKCSVPYIGH